MVVYGVTSIFRINRIFSGSYSTILKSMFKLVENEIPRVLWNILIHIWISIFFRHKLRRLTLGDIPAVAFGHSDEPQVLNFESLSLTYGLLKRTPFPSENQKYVAPFLGITDLHFISQPDVPGRVTLAPCKFTGKLLPPPRLVPRSGLKYSVDVPLLNTVRTN